MRKEIEIRGCVEVSEDTDLEGFIDEFLAWVEARGRSFGGGFREIVDGHYVLPDGSYIYQDDNELTLWGEGILIRDGVAEMLTRKGECMDLSII